MANFTIIFDDGHQECTTGGSKIDVLKRLEMQGSDYLEVIPGHINIPKGAIEKFRRDPMSILLSQVPKDAPKVKVPDNFPTAPQPQFKGVDQSALPDEPKADSSYGTTDAPPIAQGPVTQQVKEPRVFAPTPPTPTTFFTSAGVEFKVEAGEVYQKDWITADETCRIINSKSNKIYVGEQYKVQKQTWIKCQTTEPDSVGPELAH